MAKCKACGADPIEDNPIKMDDTYFSNRIHEAKNVFNKFCSDARKERLIVEVEADGSLTPVLSRVRVLRPILE